MGIAFVERSYNYFSVIPVSVIVGTEPIMLIRKFGFYQL